MVRAVVTLAATLMLGGGAAHAQLPWYPHNVPTLADEVVRYNTPPPKTIIGYDAGGVLIEYSKRWNALRMQGGEVAIVDLCASACTIIFGYIPKERICIGKDARFNFHQAGYLADNTTPNIPSTQWMIDHYPTEIQAWIKARGGMYKMPLHTYWTLTAPELWEMGYKRCSD